MNPKKTRKCKIRVWDYFSGGSILHPLGKDEKPNHYDVEAVTVGGEEGILAVFEDPRPGRNKCIAYAQGDDGHWWFAGSYHDHWSGAVSEAFLSVGSTGDVMRERLQEAYDVLSELSPLDEKGKPNTLLALAKRAMQRIQELEDELVVEKGLK